MCPASCVWHVFRLVLFAWKVSVCVSVRLYVSVLSVYIRMQAWLTLGLVWESWRKTLCNSVCVRALICVTQLEAKMCLQTWHEVIAMGFKTSLDNHCSSTSKIWAIIFKHQAVIISLCAYWMCEHELAMFGDKSEFVVCSLSQTKMKQKCHDDTN